MNAGKSKVMVYERKKTEVCDLSIPYVVNMPVVGRKEVVLEKREWSEKRFKYFQIILC